MKELRDFLRDEVFPYMASLEKEDPLVAEHFRDATLEDMDLKILDLVINQLDSLELHKLTTENKGEMYELLLSRLMRSDSAGQFYMPLQIRSFMVAMVAPDLGDNIYDPACGTAGFLANAANFIFAKYSDKPKEIPIYGEEWLEKRGQTIEEAKKEFQNLQTYLKGAGERLPDLADVEAAIYGTDVSRQMMRISRMNLIMHGIGKARLKRANVLSEMGGLNEDDLKRRYDVILSNPPIKGVLPKDSFRNDLPTKSKKSDLLFLGLIMESLAPGGRCAVVVPESILFNSGVAYKELRRRLIFDFELLAVVSLPAGVFNLQTKVKTSVLVFRRPPIVSEVDSPATSKVWFYEIQNDGYTTKKIQQGFRSEKPEQNDIPGLIEAWAKYKASNFDEAPGDKAYTILDPYKREVKSWWADYEDIKESNFNLTSSRYKPWIFAEIPATNPRQLIRQVIKIEKETISRLEKLLNKVEEL